MVRLLGDDTPVPTIPRRNFSQLGKAELVERFRRLFIDPRAIKAIKQRRVLRTLELYLMISHRFFWRRFLRVHNGDVLRSENE